MGGSKRLSVAGSPEDSHLINEEVHWRSRVQAAHASDLVNTANADQLFIQAIQQRHINKKSNVRRQFKANSFISTRPANRSQANHSNEVHRLRLQNFEFQFPCVEDLDHRSHQRRV